MKKRCTRLSYQIQCGLNKEFQLVFPLLLKCCLQTTKIDVVGELITNLESEARVSHNETEPAFSHMNVGEILSIPFFY
jgi:hypothetical protein